MKMDSVTMSMEKYSGCGSLGRNKRKKMSKKRYNKIYSVLE